MATAMSVQSDCERSGTMLFEQHSPFAVTLEQCIRSSCNSYSIVCIENEKIVSLSDCLEGRWTEVAEAPGAHC